MSVVVFDSAVEGVFLNHSDFTANSRGPHRLPPGADRLAAWPDFLVRLTRAPVASIALIRGRATGNGSEITLACDMGFASREKAILSQWEVGVGLVAGGGPMARLPHLIGRNRAIRGVVKFGRYPRRASRGLWLRQPRPARCRARRVSWSARHPDLADSTNGPSASTKRLVNTSLPPDVEFGAGWDACMASLGRPAAQAGIQALMAQGFHQPGEVENRLGYYLGQIKR